MTTMGGRCHEASRAHLRRDVGKISLCFALMFHQGPVLLSYENSISRRTYPTSVSYFLRNGQRLLTSPDMTSISSSPGTADGISVVVAGDFCLPRRHNWLPKSLMANRKTAEGAGRSWRAVGTSGGDAGRCGQGDAQSPCAVSSPGDPWSDEKVATGGIGLFSSLT